MITGNGYRITVLTDRLIRLEYQKENHFVDEPTQEVINRSFPEVRFSTFREGGDLLVETEELLLRYNEEPFSPTGLSIALKKSGAVWNYSIVYGNSDENLFGTARTLDQTDGYIELEPGIFGKRGFAVLDDSSSPVLKGTEFVFREQTGLDLYFFGYGKDFYGGLKDFFHLCGKSPMIPRYALGNWWSRYYKYTEDSYLDLLKHFREEKIPLSVAVLDMDWHLTEVPAKYGTGWTGYTWNKEYFPDYRRFLKKLKERKLSTTLNLHPADGIRAFEEMYPSMAEHMGMDPSVGKTIEFDFSSEEFRRAYFDVVIHPYEEAGVDFWWIDWQQGTGQGAEDVDPLLLLNHYHYKDQEDRQKRPMIFSRYAGPGSHRYPVGFSGDTFVSWASLSFQPYFTSTASNIGYGWWSHDIGGHMLGDKDLARLTRWVQYGVFSPIMRIHSSNSSFLNKEPWNLEQPYRSIITEFMRLRHRLIPYLYSMTYQAFRDDRPLIRPMYYLCPEDEDAYTVPGEYGFGSSLIVGAITSPEDPVLRLSAVNCLIPKGTWYDIFNGRIYNGKRKRKLYRPLEEIPVLLPAGGILPENSRDTENGTDNPETIRLLIGLGADGTFELYEDDGISMNYQNGAFVQTHYEIRFDKEKGEAALRISAAEGDLSLIPEKRSYEIWFYGAASKEGTMFRVTEAGENDVLSYELDEERRILKVSLDFQGVDKEREIRVGGLIPAQNDYERLIFTLLDRAWIKNQVKEEIWSRFHQCPDNDSFLRWLEGMDVQEDLKDAIREVGQGDVSF